MKAPKGCVQIPLARGEPGCVLLTEKDALATYNDKKILTSYRFVRPFAAARIRAALSGKPALTARQRKAIERLREVWTPFVSLYPKTKSPSAQSVAAVLAEFKEEKARG